MPERTFAQLQAELQNVLTRLKQTKDPKVRRELLHEMRRLLAEADRGIAKAE
jgi:formiminotetrahydrofolate cyclodeaminase